MIGDLKVLALQENLDSPYHAQEIFTKQANTQETSVKAFMDNWAKSNVAPLFTFQRQET